MRTKSGVKNRSGREEHPSVFPLYTVWLSNRDTLLKIRKGNLDLRANKGVFYRVGLELVYSIMYT